MFKILIRSIIFLSFILFSLIIFLLYNLYKWSQEEDKRMPCLFSLCRKSGNVNVSTITQSNRGKIATRDSEISIGKYTNHLRPPQTVHVPDIIPEPEIIPITVPTPNTTHQPNIIPIIIEPTITSKININPEPNINHEPILDSRDSKTSDPFKYLEDIINVEYDSEPIIDSKPTLDVEVNKISDPIVIVEPLINVETEPNIAPKSALVIKPIIHTDPGIISDQLISESVTIPEAIENHDPIIHPKPTVIPDQEVIENHEPIMHPKPVIIPDQEAIEKHEPIIHPKPTVISDQEAIENHEQIIHPKPTVIPDQEAIEKHEPIIHPKPSVILDPNVFSESVTTNTENHEAIIHSEPDIILEPNIYSDSDLYSEPVIYPESIINPDSNPVIKESNDSENIHIPSEEKHEDEPKLTEEFYSQNDTKLDRISNDSINSIVDNRNGRRRGVPIDIINVDKKLDRISLNKIPKNPQEEKQIHDALTANEFMNQLLNEDKIKLLVDIMYPKCYKATECIINEGEKGSHMYVSAEGKFEILLKNKLTQKQYFEGGEVFGELAILYTAKRNATIKAVTDCKVWVLDKDKYLAITVRRGIQEHENKVNFLKTVPFLKEIEHILPKVANLLHEEFFTAGSIIIQQGEPGDKFYIIRAGSVTIKRDSKLLGTKIRGQFFGELALKVTDVRMATVIANSPGVECFTLDREYFLKYFEKIDKILEEISAYDTPDSLRIEDKSSKATNKIKTNEFESIEMEDLTIIGSLGVGAFGRVMLVQHIVNKNTFALKYLKRAKIKQIQHAINERDLMFRCDSPFICKLYQTYKDSDYLYYLMEAFLGGDVFEALRIYKGFDEKTARFMTACVIEAFDYLHKRNIIYRDLKPENLMLDHKGYVKLVDFGVATRIESGASRWTIVGTPEYLAPEVILHEGHNQCVDLWTLGILVHELILFKPPFRGKDQMATYSNILRGINAVPLSSKLSNSVKALIQGLCRRTPLERLGAQKAGFNDLRNHKWFVGFDWVALKNEKLPAPLVRPVKTNTDLSNFKQF